MMRYLSIIFIVLMAGQGRGQASFFTEFKPLADSLGQSYKIPPCVILSIAYHESGGGKSKVGKLLNNHFGIVGSNKDCPHKGIKSKYKYFPTILDCYVAFCKIISSKDYFEKLKDEKNLEKWVHAIADHGYAGTNQNWRPHVLKTVRKFCGTGSAERK